MKNLEDIQLMLEPALSHFDAADSIEYSFVDGQLHLQKKSFSRALILAIINILPVSYDFYISENHYGTNTIMAIWQSR